MPDERLIAETEPLQDAISTLKIMVRAAMARQSDLRAATWLRYTSAAMLTPDGQERPDHELAIRRPLGDVDVLCPSLTLTELLVLGRRLGLDGRLPPKEPA